MLEKIYEATKNEENASVQGEMTKLMTETTLKGTGDTIDVTDDMVMAAEDSLIDAVIDDEEERKAIVQVDDDEDDSDYYEEELEGLLDDYEDIDEDDGDEISSTKYITLITHNDADAMGC